MYVNGSRARPYFVKMTTKLFCVSIKDLGGDLFTRTRLFRVVYTEGVN